MEGISIPEVPIETTASTLGWVIGVMFLGYGFLIKVIISQKNENQTLYKSNEEQQEREREILKKSIEVLTKNQLVIDNLIQTVSENKNNVSNHVSSEHKETRNELEKAATEIKNIIGNIK